MCHMPYEVGYYGFVIIALQILSNECNTINYHFTCTLQMKLKLRSRTFPKATQLINSRTQAGPQGSLLSKSRAFTLGDSGQRPLT